MNRNAEVLSPSQPTEELSSVEFDARTQGYLEMALPGGIANFFAVREISKILRQEAHSLLSKTQGPVTRVGFGEAPKPAVSAAVLIQRLAKAQIRLEAIASEDSDQTPIGINSRSAALNLQAHVELLSSWLEENSRAGAIPPGKRSLVHQGLIEFKSALSELIQKLDTLLAPLSAGNGEPKN